MQVINIGPAAQVPRFSFLTRLSEADTVKENEALPELPRARPPSTFVFILDMIIVDVPSHFLLGRVPRECPLLIAVLCQLWGPMSNPE